MYDYAHSKKNVITMACLLSMWVKNSQKLRGKQELVSMKTKKENKSSQFLRRCNKALGRGNRVGRHRVNRSADDRASALSR